MRQVKLTLRGNDRFHIMAGRITRQYLTANLHIHCQPLDDTSHSRVFLQHLTLLLIPLKRKKKLRSLAILRQSNGFALQL